MQMKVDGMAWTFRKCHYMQRHIHLTWNLIKLLFCWCLANPRIKFCLHWRGNAEITVLICRDYELYYCQLCHLILIVNICYEHIQWSSIKRLNWLWLFFGTSPHGSLQLIMKLAVFIRQLRECCDLWIAVPSCPILFPFNLTVDGASFRPTGVLSNNEPTDAVSNNENLIKLYSTSELMPSALARRAEIMFTHVFHKLILVILH